MVPTCLRNPQRNKELGLDQQQPRDEIGQQLEIPTAFGRQAAFWVEDVTREIVQDKVSLQVYKVWAGVLIPCTQRNGTSGSACQLTNLWEKKENRVQIEEPVNENMIISEFRKLTPRFYCAEFQNYS